MLVTFHCKDSAPVTLFGQVAVQLLHMMGHSGKVPGALYAEDVAKHLASLQEKFSTGPKKALWPKPATARTLPLACFIALCL
jgi:Domain of unknown function (DUF1840)